MDNSSEDSQASGKKSGGESRSAGSSTKKKRSPLLPRKSLPQGGTDNAPTASNAPGFSKTPRGSFGASGGIAVGAAGGSSEGVTGAGGGGSGGSEGGTAGGSQDDEDYQTNGGGGSGASDITNDEMDGGDDGDFHTSTIDPARTKAAIDSLQAKIQKTMALMRQEQDAKEVNVNEYLRLSVQADRTQTQRIKALFEKKNQKSTATIAALQRKLDGYHKRLREVEMHGVSGHRQAKEVLKDVGQGLKVWFTRDLHRSRDPSPHRDVGANIRDGLTGFSGGVVDNIRGAKESIVSKPKEFAHLIKNTTWKHKFGSADNINNIKSLDDMVLEDVEKSSQYSGGNGGPLGPSVLAGGSSTGSVLRHVNSSSHLLHRTATPPPNSCSFRAGNSMFYTTPSSGYKYSDDEASSVTSDSGPSRGRSSPRPHSDSAALSNKHRAGTASEQLLAGHTPPPSALGVTSPSGQPPAALDLVSPLLAEISDHKEMTAALHESLDSIRKQMSDDYAMLKQLLDEERFRSERLEEQINDLTELHQHEVTNIKQELSSMEEKMEYQLEERTRDMQELLENCQTRITKMELQQQQQQLISMEGIDNSNFRALLTKLINVLLALLAVLLVLVSTAANCIGPFLTTRFRILSTVCLICIIVAVWQNWSHVSILGDSVGNMYHSLLGRSQ